MPALMSQRTPQTDFDLHGLFGIRLLDAEPRDAAAVARQIGPIQAPLARAPDLTIQFVDELPLRSTMRYIGLDAAFTEDAFLILRSKHKTSTRVQLPMAELGRPCEIICEHGLPAVPLLMAIINLSLVGKGLLPLHASAFHYQGRGVLVTGWAKGGKTETLLSFMAQGARYIGDEWIYLNRDGRMYGIPEPIRLWDWHLRELPQYWRRVRRGDRFRLRSLRLAIEFVDRLAAGRPSVGSLSQRAAGRVAALLKRQHYVQMPPQQLFGEAFGPLEGSLDVLIFAASHDTPDVVVETIDPAEVAARMVASLQEERSSLWSYYRRFRFAFPMLVNELLEHAEQQERAMLSEFLANKPAFTVRHPYPISIPSLFTAIGPELLP
jgi:hypothetical protein